MKQVIEAVIYTVEALLAWVGVSLTLCIIAEALRERGVFKDV